MVKTIDDLKSLSAELAERRRKEAYKISGADHDDALKKLVRVHLAIAAIDQVIKEIEGERKPEIDAMLS